MRDDISDLGIEVGGPGFTGSISRERRRERVKDDVDEWLDSIKDGQKHVKVHYSRQSCYDMASMYADWDAKLRSSAMSTCGTWQFCYRKDDDTIVEQCDECGEYRERDAV